MSSKDRRHVYFSVTSDNPFLPDWYIRSLEEDLDPKMARRMIYGEWVDIEQDVVYHQYGPHNYKDSSYEINPLLPIYVSFDFNIGLGKPMSACLSQYDEQTDHFHFYAESVVEGADTMEQMEEMAARGLFDIETEYRITGDASGANKHSSSNKKSDYDIIYEFLSKYRTPYHSRVHFTRCVPASNPPIRFRHNRVNAYCRNALNKTRLFVYDGCKTLDEGMRLTALKKGGNYIEDDSKAYQHVTTALGYNVCWVDKSKDRRKTINTTRIR